MLALLPLILACGGDGRIDDVLALEGDPTNGEAVYLDTCAGCHGEDGTGGSAEGIVGEDEGEDELAEVILFGEDEMPAFDGDLTDQEIADVIAFVTDVLQAG
jgi:mono/diheme cytochrome c family protein